MAKPAMTIAGADMIPALREKEQRKRSRIKATDRSPTSIVMRSLTSAVQARGHAGQMNSLGAARVYARVHLLAWKR